MNKNGGLKSFLKEFLIISAFLLIGGCEPSLEKISREGSEVNLVVEGEINDMPGPFYIKVSYSADISNPHSNPKVSNLEISVEDQQENKFFFRESDAKGIYEIIDSTFVGQLESSYHLNINSESGDLYKSLPQKLTLVPQIDTLYFNNAVEYFSEDSIIIFNDKFFAQIEFKDNPSTRDYYRWKVFINGKFREQPGSIYLENDLIFNGKVKTMVFSSDTLIEDDEIIIQQFSLSQSGYEYWNLLKTQASNIGTPFSPAPALIKGNIKNLKNPNELIIGHFDVSSKVSIQSKVMWP